MKLRNIFTMLAAVFALTFVGCQKQEQFLEEVKVSKSYIALPVEGGDVKIQVEASANWTITAWDSKAAKAIELPEWLSINPASGPAGNSEITFSAGATTETREALLHLDCDGATQVINVMQMAAKPEVALTTCKFVLEEGVVDQFYRIKAKVAEIPLADFQKYGKFYISDDSTAEKVQIYGCANKSAYLDKSNNPTIAVGDIVVIEGSWSKYGNFNNDTQILEVEKSLIKAEKVIPSTPLPVEGGVVTVVLTIKGDDLTVVIPEDATWLTAGEPNVIGTSTFVDLTAAPNEGDPRSTTVDFKTTSNGQTYVASVTVEQNAGVIAEPEITAISSILALDVDATVAKGTVIEAVVISNSALGNLTSKKGMYVQDETGALQLRFNEDHTFAFGDKVKIDLSGAKFGKYNEAVQVSNLANDKVVVLSSGNTVEPKTVSVADFLANKYEGQYIALKGVQVVEEDLTKTFVMPNADGEVAHTSISIETVGGENFVVFSSKYASFGKTAVPQGSGTIKGISSRNNDAIQIIFAQESDFAGLTGERFVAGQEPEQPAYPTIAEVIAAGVQDEATTEGVIVAKYTRGALIYDGTAYILIYKNAVVEEAVGDKIQVTGPTSLYGGMLQFTKDAKITKVSSGNEVVHPEPTVLDAAGMDAQLAKTAVEYVEYTGTLSISGNYYNVNIEGAATAIGSLQYIDAAAHPAAVDGAKITVRGYFIGVSSGKYVNTMTVSVSAAN